MSYRNREIESKLLILGKSLEEINVLLYDLFNGEITKQVLGSSLDHYWTVPNPEADADFVRVRERDGCCQVTVKARDRKTALNRMEMEYTTTAPLADVLAVTAAQHGPSEGVIGKTYYVYWIGDEYTTVCCYKVATPVFDPIVIEVETTHMTKLMELEGRVLQQLKEHDISTERAPGSLYEMLIAKKQGE